MAEPIVGRIYRHYKGGIYRVLDLPEHTETRDVMVYYEHENGRTYARPRYVWESDASDGNERFALLPEGSPEERLFARAG